MKRSSGLLTAALTAMLLSACSNGGSQSADRSGQYQGSQSGTMMAATGKSADPAEGRVSHATGKVEILSPVYHVDQIYRSMKGPWSRQNVPLLDSRQPELVWVTGCRVEMVAEDGQRKMPEQFMCHANFDFNTQRHNALFNSSSMMDGRIFTLSQGQLEVKCPPGFGLPFASDETIELVTQVLNLNLKNPSFHVRHKITIDLVRDRDLTTPIKPLYEIGVYGMKALDGKELCFDRLVADNSAALCLPGLKANEHDQQTDRFGRRFTGHWIVKPGREVNRTRVTTRLGLPQDTTVHHIAVHLHPFAESLELRDMTENKSVFKSRATNLSEGIGLARVEYFSSIEGLPLRQDHEYEIVSVYRNTTKEDQDSMAVMYLYLLDKKFRKPSLAGPIGLSQR